VANYTLFKEELPSGQLIDATKGGNLKIGIGEAQHFAGLYDDLGNPLQTTIWGYGAIRADGTFTPTWPGPTIVAKQGKPLSVTFRNNLPSGGYPGGHLLPFDPTYDTIAAAVNNLSLLPTNVHLHGGDTDASSDGYPTQVYTQGQSFTNYYDNSQQAGTLWYHPHTQGRTRLDVYAGLAGFYLLRDNNEEKLIRQGLLPGGAQKLEMAVTDRMFTDNGQLFYPSTSDSFYAPGELEDRRTELSGFLESQGLLPTGGLPPVPTVTGLPEFIGDRILTNGMVWPHQDVTETQYRVHLLNASDSRSYVFELHDNQTDTAGTNRYSFYQVGTDAALLKTPVELQRLVLEPGQRADVVIDFKALMATAKARDGVANTQFFLRNYGPDAIFEGFENNTAAISTPNGFQNAVVDDPADPTTTGQVMRFDVTPGKVPQSNFDPKQILNPALDRLFKNDLNEEKSTYTRRLGLFEGSDKFGRIMPMLGSVEPVLDQTGAIVNGSLMFSDPGSEVVKLDKSGKATEIWEIYNTTVDAHPIHLHQTSFRILDRTPIDVKGELAQKPQMMDGGYGSGITFDAPAAGRLYGSIDDYVVKGTAFGPQINETGLQDTVIALPGQMTRIVATFDKPGDYVWHCHILSHEDSDMMRKLTVLPYGQDAPGKVIQGSTSSDKLVGTNHDDLLIGYGGGDIFTGGEGRDVFKFTKPNPLLAKFQVSPVGSDKGDNLKNQEKEDLFIKSNGLQDRILDFQVGFDKIDLHELLTGINYLGTDPLRDRVVSVSSSNSNSSVVKVFAPGSGNLVASIGVESERKGGSLNNASNFIF
jgi:spore coat protein A, manganese oxidase